MECGSRKKEMFKYGGIVLTQIKNIESKAADAIVAKEEQDEKQESNQEAR